MEENMIGLNFVFEKDELLYSLKLSTQLIKTIAWIILILIIKVLKILLITWNS